MTACAQDALADFAAAPCGDVLAARRCAAALLASRSGPEATCAAERLVVTALLIHLHARSEEFPSEREVLATLDGLSRCEGTQRDLAESPSALLRYVGAELIARRFPSHAVARPPCPDRPPARRGPEPKG